MGQNRVRKVMRRKLAFVGDRGCGKTSLLARFSLGYFPPHDLPTVFESYINEVRVDGRSIQLVLWDTTNREDGVGLRCLAYSKSHAILVGFSVDNLESLENARLKWMKEAREKCPKASIIFVGLRKDLREKQFAAKATKQKSLEFVTSGQASETAAQCGAQQYLECSSLTGEGVDNVFVAARRAALMVVHNRSEESGRCRIL